MEVLAGATISQLQLLFEKPLTSARTLSQKPLILPSPSAARKRLGHAKLQVHGEAGSAPAWLPDCVSPRLISADAPGATALYPPMPGGAGQRATA